MNRYHKIFDFLCRQIKTGSLTVTYWDEGSTSYGTGEPHLDIIFKNPGILSRILANPELVLLDAVLSGEVEVPGGIPALVRFTVANKVPAPVVVQKLGKIRDRLRRKKPLIDRNRTDVSSHYDLGNEFFELWLDPTMTYSCAYFRTPEDSLETAQRQKINHVLTKVRGRAGESLLDLGCGWGGVIKEAADGFGMDAVGITLSQEQVTWFQNRNQPASSGAHKIGKAQSRLIHYHDMALEGRTFDKIVSVGILEHVGQEQLGAFAKDVKALLKPGGLALLHCITVTEQRPVMTWMTKHIFPGGYVPAVAELVRHFSDQSLIILDVENLGAHYALTLDHWLANFDQHVPEVEARYDAEFVKIWRMYLSLSAEAFRYDDLYVHQFLLSNGRPLGIPLTREHMYAGVSGATKCLAQPSP